MMEIKTKTITIIGVFLTILHLFALGLTVFRLRHRYRTRRLWCDDYFAALAGLIDLAGLLVFWMDYAPPESPLQTLRASMSRYGVGVFTIISTEWTVRVSLAFAFARIFAPEDPTRNYAICLAIGFAMIFITVIVQGTVYCSKISSWIFDTGLIQCNFSKSLLIYLIVVNVIADMLLVLSPMYKLRNVKLPPTQRRLIFACLAGSTMMSLSCFATSVFQIAPMSWEPARGFIRVLLGYFESGISLVICNLLVVVTYIYTKLHRQRDEETDIQSSEEPKTSSSTIVRPSSTERETRFNGSVITPIDLTEISETYFTRRGTDIERR